MHLPPFCSDNSITQHIPPRRTGGCFLSAQLKYIYTMKKKLLFLTSVLLLSAIGLSSCSKDEPTAPDMAKENVAGTKWLGYHKYDGSMTLRFYKDGTYRLDYDTMTGYSEGSYTQSGNALTFKEISGRQHWYNFSKGTISTYGMTLTIPMYYYDGKFAHDVKFTLASD